MERQGNIQFLFNTRETQDVTNLGNSISTQVCNFPLHVLEEKNK